MSKYKDRLHLPIPGVTVGLRGWTLCGRNAYFYTADHEQIRRQALSNPEPGVYCQSCLKADQKTRRPKKG